ncbi:hypothetical protein CC80DRAFT_487983 [Byssothecium circinans]|uniref:F-box domain-containing protein n=1 Tax=Byssothecium circinans TaxID=147558 RepID=A0A6A5UE21_9PLEO|nr:hypothetical protein CC80DRAFT_487983 [Byssothecium circinans]
MTTNYNAPAMEPAKKSIFDCLPDELLVQIISHLALDKRSLCSLARACSFFRHECEKHIYTTIDLLSTDDLRAIIEAFARRPERIASVETLNIVYSFHDGIGTTLQERTSFNDCVKKMKALRNWHIESPFDNFKWNNEGGREWVEEDMEEFRRALEGASLREGVGGLIKSENVGLARLEKLTIHSHGASSDFWDLNSFHCLFRHPTLRSLHVSCFVLPTDLPELELYTKSTALTTLVFDECILTPKSLERILKTPKTLKQLTLGENVYNDRRSVFDVPKLTERPEATLEALSAVAHSLESLTHLDPMWKRANDGVYKQFHINGSGLRDFHRLKYLDVDPCSFLHQFILSHRQAPPNLETFRIHHALVKYFEEPNDNLTDLFEELPSIGPYTALGSLKTLEFVQAASLETHLARPEHICQEDAFRDRHVYGYKLFKQGINMKMYLEASWRMGLMPPYLHKEQKPELICVYDAARVGFHRHLREEETGLQVGLPASDEILHAELLDETPTSEIIQAAHAIPSNSPDTKKGADGQAAQAKQKQPPETDQLRKLDIIAFKNEVRRSILSLRHRMARMADDSDDELMTPNVIFFSDDDLELYFDEDDDDMDDDDDETEFFDPDMDAEELYGLELTPDDMDDLETHGLDEDLEIDVDAVLHAAHMELEQGMNYLHDAGLLQYGLDHDSSDQELLDVTGDIPDEGDREEGLEEAADDEEVDTSGDEVYADAEVDHHGDTTDNNGDGDSGAVSGVSQGTSTAM